MISRLRTRAATYSPRSRGIACVLFSVLVWSGWMIVSSYSVRGSLTAYDITALRFGTAGIILLPVLLRMGLRVGPWGIWGGLALAVLMGAPYNTIAIFGMKFAPASHAAGIINTTMLLGSTLGGILLLKEKTTGLRVFGMLVSVIGIACLLSSTGKDADHDGMMLGHICFLIGGMIWSIYAVLMKSWKADALHVTAAVCVYSCIFYLPIYFLFLPANIHLSNWHEAAFQAIYQGIINSVGAMVCYNRGIALLGASTSSAFLPLIPAIATVAAIPFLGQTPGPMEWVGIALAMGGVFFSSGIAGQLLRRPAEAETV